VLYSYGIAGQRTYSNEISAEARVGSKSQRRAGQLRTFEEINHVRRLRTSPRWLRRRHMRAVPASPPARMLPRHPCSPLLATGRARACSVPTCTRRHGRLELGTAPGRMAAQQGPEARDGGAHHRDPSACRPLSPPARRAPRAPAGTAKPCAFRTKPLIVGSTTQLRPHKNAGEDRDRWR
jgi:hypothetical protein